MPPPGTTKTDYNDESGNDPVELLRSFDPASVAIRASGDDDLLSRLVRFSGNLKRYALLVRGRGGIGRTVDGAGAPGVAKHAGTHCCVGKVVTDDSDVTPAFAEGAVPAAADGATVKRNTRSVPGCITPPFSEAEASMVVRASPAAHRTRYYANFEDGKCGRDPARPDLVGASDQPMRSSNQEIKSRCSPDSGNDDDGAKSDNVGAAPPSIKAKTTTRKRMGGPTYASSPVVVSITEVRGGRQLEGVQKPMASGGNDKVDATAGDGRRDGDKNGAHSALPVAVKSNPDVSSAAADRASSAASSSSPASSPDPAPASSSTVTGTTGADKAPGFVQVPTNGTTGADETMSSLFEVTPNRLRDKSAEVPPSELHRFSLGQGATTEAAAATPEAKEGGGSNNRVAENVPSTAMTVAASTDPRGQSSSLPAAAVLEGRARPRQGPRDAKGGLGGGILQDAKSTLALQNLKGRSIAMTATQEKRENRQRKSREKPDVDSCIPAPVGVAAAGRDHRGTVLCQRSRPPENASDREEATSNGMLQSQQQEESFVVDLTLDGDASQPGAPATDPSCSCIGLQASSFSSFVDLTLEKEDDGGCIEYGEAQDDQNAMVERESKNGDGDKEEEDGAEGSQFLKGANTMSDEEKQQEQQQQRRAQQEPKNAAAATADADGPHSNTMTRQQQQRDQQERKEDAPAAAAVDRGSLPPLPFPANDMNHEEMQLKEQQQRRCQQEPKNAAAAADNGYLSTPPAPANTWIHEGNQQEQQQQQRDKQQREIAAAANVGSFSTPPASANITTREGKQREEEEQQQQQRRYQREREEEDVAAAAAVDGDSLSSPPAPANTITHEVSKLREQQQQQQQQQQQPEDKQAREVAAAIAAIPSGGLSRSVPPVAAKRKRGRPVGSRDKDARKRRSSTAFKLFDSLTRTASTTSSSASTREGRDTAVALGRAHGKLRRSDEEEARDHKDTMSERESGGDDNKVDADAKGSCNTNKRYSCRQNSGGDRRQEVEWGTGISPSSSKYAPAGDCPARSATNSHDDDTNGVGPARSKLCLFNNEELRDHKISERESNGSGKEVDAYTKRSCDDTNKRCSCRQISASNVDGDGERAAECEADLPTALNKHAPEGCDQTQTTKTSTLLSAPDSEASDNTFKGGLAHSKQRQLDDGGAQDHKETLAERKLNSNAVGSDGEGLVLIQNRRCQYSCQAISVSKVNGEGKRAVKCNLPTTRSNHAPPCGGMTRTATMNSLFSTTCSGVHDKNAQKKQAAESKATTQSASSPPTQNETKDKHIQNISQRETANTHEYRNGLRNDQPPACSMAATMNSLLSTTGRGVNDNAGKQAAVSETATQSASLPPTQKESRDNNNHHQQKVPAEATTNKNSPASHSVDIEKISPQEKTCCSGPRNRQQSHERATPTLIAPAARTNSPCPFPQSRTQQRTPNDASVPASQFGVPLMPYWQYAPGPIPMGPFSQACGVPYMQYQPPKFEYPYGGFCCFSFWLWQTSSKRSGRPPHDPGCYTRAKSPKT